MKNTKWFFILSFKKMNSFFDVRKIFYSLFRIYQTFVIKLIVFASFYSFRILEIDCNITSRNLISTKPNSFFPFIHAINLMIESL